MRKKVLKIYIGLLINVFLRKNKHAVNLFLKNLMFTT